jgi:hypothetical protein
MCQGEGPGEHEPIRWRASGSALQAAAGAPGRTHRTGPQAGARLELVLGRHGPRAGEKEVGQPGPVGRNSAHGQ